MIGDDVEVTILAVSGEKVRVGIDAPRSVPVFRKEVWIDMAEDRRKSTGTAGSPPSG